MIQQHQELWSYDEKTYKLLFQNLNYLRKSKVLCDVKIRVESQLFDAHRLILCACSDYFLAMFTNEMKEKDSQIIEIKGISAKTMELLLDCIYSEEILLNIENVQEILPAAALLQLNDIRAGCEEFLKKKLDSHNCLGIKSFAELHDCENLRNATKEYIYEHFSQVVQNSDEFYNLKAKELEELIKSNDIEVSNEEVVYNCLMNWIQYDAANREQCLPKLLRHVRLPLLSPQFLTDVCDNEPMIKRSFECRDMLDEAKRFYLRPDCRGDMMSEIRFKLRTGKDEHMVMLGGVGSSQKILDVVEKFSPNTNTWSMLPPLTKKRRYAAAAAIGQNLYIIGGYDTKTRLKSVEKLDLSMACPQWQQVTPMLYKRALPAVCVHQNVAYVCGGYDGQSRSSTMESYDPELDKWTLLDSLSVPREGAGLVVLGDSMYCLGGFDGSFLLKSVERYDFHSCTWSPAACMLTPRSGAGCVSLNYRIFVLGGFDGQNHLSSVETFNSITGQWSVVTSLASPRCYCAATLLHGKIVVVGGYDGKDTLSSMEEYDEVKNSWSIKSHMPTSRCDAGFAVIKYRDIN